MARTPKNQTAPEIEENPDVLTPEPESPGIEENQNTPVTEPESPGIEENESAEPAVNDTDPVDRILKLYPQYKEVYITPNGFVHPKGVPAYLIKGAKLYKNKFYNKN